MKKMILTLFMSLGLLLSFTTTALATPETFNIDPTHSFVTWTINHFGFSNPSGKWSFEGRLVLDEAKPKDSKVNITITIANIITGVPKLDEHLKETDFFDVEKYPTATFTSNKVEVTGKNKAKVHGILTLHGVSKPITLNVTLNKIAEGNYTHKRTAGLQANTTLKRSDFGITKYLPGLGDEVKIHIESEAILG